MNKYLIKRLDTFTLSKGINLFWSVLVIASLTACAVQKIKSGDPVFDQIQKENWVKVFEDSGTKDWKEKWLLDGEKSTIFNDEKGMSLYAGPVHNDSCHTVLWTKESFAGDIMIQYEYTKIDTYNLNVTILYLQATGEPPYSANIHEWSEERRVPSMRTYFNNMNTLHISYAALSNSDSMRDYIRGRRYMPTLKKGLKGTRIGESYYNTGFFEKDIPHQITVVKRKSTLYMWIKNKEQERLFTFPFSDFPSITEGFIGFRHMNRRGARYKNIKVFLLK